jgi:hypothetical protein
MIRSASLSTHVSGKGSKQPGERTQAPYYPQWPSPPISPIFPRPTQRSLKSIPRSCPWSVTTRTSPLWSRAQSRYTVRRPWGGGCQRWISWLLLLSLRLMLKLVQLRRGLGFGKKCMIRYYNSLVLLLWSLYSLGSMYTSILRINE